MGPSRVAAVARAVAPGAAFSFALDAFAGGSSLPPSAGASSGRFATTFVLGAKKLDIERMPCAFGLGGAIAAATEGGAWTARGELLGAIDPRVQTASARGVFAQKVSIPGAAKASSLEVPR